MKLLIGIILGLALYPAFADITELVDDKLNTDIWIHIGVPSYGLTLGLTGRCTSNLRPNGITNAKYFGCGKLNIAISEALYSDKKDVK